MFDIEYPAPAERVVLAAVHLRKDDDEFFDNDIKEMKMLCSTAGGKVVETIVQKADKPRAASYFGKGKVEEIVSVMKKKKADTLVVDAELTHSQIKNIEKNITGKVIDRSQLILDIFSQHAKTSEARLQVELAQLRVLYPRLTHAWSHLSKQFGGIGTRGPGEKQLEVDRRLVQKKIVDLKKRLSKIEKSRNTRRKNRKGVTRAVLVGYTNAGKSSLLNALSGSKEFVENKLFATLDTATRKVYLPDAGEIVVSDTVGFIRKLPHQLVASFRSTLGVVAEADLVMVVLDVSDPNCSEQLKTVEEVLKDLGADEIPRIKILNKSDRLNDDFERKGAAIEHRDSILVSAFSRDDMDRLKGMMGDRITALIKERERKKLIEKKTRETYSFEYRQ